jgi:ATP-dependent RNA helicase RhlE
MSNQNKKTRTGFDRFRLMTPLLQGIRAAGFDKPRPIQDETIPAGLAGDDVMGLAQTGTGKTAAFALPMLDHLLRERGRGPRALILAPTRELATQIVNEIKVLAKFTNLTTVTIYGGIPMVRQLSALNRDPDIVVGCPGRILDLLNRRALPLGNIGTLVLDEADHMFDMGFLPDVRKIMAALPEQRQNLLFSATMPKEVRRLANEVLYEPYVVELANATPAETIDHALVMVGEQRKRDLLEHFLAGRDCDSAIVFTRTKHRARRLAEQLRKKGHRAVDLQGNRSQAQRDRAMRGFRARQYDVLVATDIVARGIDVSGVSHVINFDVPTTPEAYTHRIGRTGRAEQEGIACTFVTGEDKKWLMATERMIGKPIARREVAGFEFTAQDEAQRRPARQPQNRSRGPWRPNGPSQGGGGGRPRQGGGGGGGQRRRRTR